MLWLEEIYSKMDQPDSISTVWLQVQCHSASLALNPRSVLQFLDLAQKSNMLSLRQRRCEDATHKVVRLHPSKVKHGLKTKLILS